MPSILAAFSLSSFKAFKAFWIACFSKTAKGTIFLAPPEACEAAFFFVDFLVFATIISPSFVVLPNAASEPRRCVSALPRSCAAVHGAPLVLLAQCGIRLQAQQWPCRYADVRPLVPRLSAQYPTQSPNSRIGNLILSAKLKRVTPQMWQSFP